jgi:hypothetical protein
MRRAKTYAIGFTPRLKNGEIEEEKWILLCRD